jgi:hypothetical protein
VAADTNPLLHARPLQQDTGIIAHNVSDFGPDARQTYRVWLSWLKLASLSSTSSPVQAQHQQNHRMQRHPALAGAEAQMAEKIGASADLAVSSDLSI